MGCPRCGHSTSGSSGQCPVCGLKLGDSGIATSVIPIDTTGLPEGATFGASSGAGETFAATMADGATGAQTGAPDGALRSGPLQVGQGFGARYHIIKVLGVGGMGAVYQAWDAELSVAVALKVIRTSSRHRHVSAEAEKQFKHELLLARQVTHKNVVRIHDLGEIDGIKYITMPYVQGDDLATVLRRDGKLPIERALRLARHMASGLEAAHDAGIVHRDLKPANVMIGAEDVALIMDFGISASRDEAASGAIVGTLEYMAPEQGTGGTVDSRADIYAFGLMLYEMLAGPRPSTATTAQDRIDAMTERITKGLPPLRSVDATIPAPLEALVMRCLDRDPAARFEGATALVASLNRLDDVGELIPIARRITKPAMAGAIVLVLLMIVATYIVTWRAVQPPTQHEPVSVVLADLKNATADPTFDGTLEPMLKLALEDAGFISAYDRSSIRRSLGVRPPQQFDERAAQEVAVKQGLGVVVSGSVDRQGTGYAISLKATHAVTGDVIITARGRASNKDEVLPATTKLAATVRKALGDDRSEAAQRFATQTFSATSLEVVREYAGAADALSRSRFDEAVEKFSKAVALDPNFGLGYAGLASAARNLDKQRDAEKHIKEAVRHLDGMTERERYRTRGLFYMINSDYPNCVKEYSELVARYAADAAAGNNLALCLTHVRKIREAVEQMRHVVTILPKRALYRENLAQYAVYASEFETAEREAQAMEEPGLFGLIALAFAQLGQGRLPEATQTYGRLAGIDDQGASYTASGLGDLAIYEGRYSDAARILEQGAAADLTSKDTDRGARKLAALAYAQVLRQQKATAIATAEKALANSDALKIRFLAGRVFVEAGAVARARTLAASLASEILAEPQAYAKIIEGELALASGDARQALKLLTEANALLDSWMGHFDLGRAYLAVGAFAQADSEFDRCIARRGEALSLFLDEEPTSGYFPPVYYYQGRVREGLKNAGFADSYRAYLAIRGESKEDPLVRDARQRAR